MCDKTVRFWSVHGSLEGRRACDKTVRWSTLKDGVMGQGGGRGLEAGPPGMGIAKKLLLFGSLLS